MLCKQFLLSGLRIKKRLVSFLRLLDNFGVVCQLRLFPSLVLHSLDVCTEFGGILRDPSGVFIDLQIKPRKKRIQQRDDLLVFPLAFSRI